MGVTARVLVFRFWKRLLNIVNIDNFLLFSCNFQGNISYQKLQNCWMVLKTPSHEEYPAYRVQIVANCAMTFNNL